MTDERVKAQWDRLKLLRHGGPITVACVHLVTSDRAGAEPVECAAPNIPCRGRRTAGAEFHRERVKNHERQVADLCALIAWEQAARGKPRKYPRDRRHVR